MFLSESFRHYCRYDRVDAAVDKEQAAYPHHVDELDVDVFVQVDGRDDGDENGGDGEKAELEGHAVH